MIIRTNDIIRLRNESGNFEIAEVWSDNEVLLVGGRIADISDVESVRREES